MAGAPEVARKIANGPLYPRAQVEAILAKGAMTVVLWTEDCNSDVVVKLGWETSDVVALVKHALSTGRFKGSEWCDQRPSGPVAACDAYSVKNIEWNQAAKKDLPVEYYVKFAISKPGTHLLVASCHV